MRKLFLFCIITFILCTFPLAEASPQTQTSLGVDPAILEIILDPDVPTVQNIKLTNISNLPQPIKTLKQGFTPEEKLSMTTEEAKVFDSSSWISIADEDMDFILQPHETKTITLTITPPEDASPGGHYSTVIFQPLIPQELISSQSIFVYGRVAVLIFMQTKGDIIQKIDYVRTDKKTISENGNLSFNIILSNTGNTHIQPSGKVRIYNDITNEVIASEDFPSLIILPGTEKTFPVDINITAPLGKFSVESSINYGADSIVLKSQRESFLILPYTIIIFFVLPAIIILMLGIKFRTRFISAFNVLLYNKASGNDKKSMFKPRPHIRFRLGKKR